MKKIKMMLALLAALVCGGAWAAEQVLVSDTHLTTTAWTDTNWTVDSLDELLTYSYYGTMAGSSIGSANVIARGFFVRKEGLTVTVQMQVHQNGGSGNNYLKAAKIAMTLNDQKHVLVKGVAAGNLSGGNVGTEITNWNSTFGSGAYGVNNLKADKLPSAFSKPGLKMWLDAADAATITSDSEGVKKWADKAANAQDASPSTAYIMIDGVKTGVTRYASVETVNGNAAIQMGEVSSGIDLAFAQMTDIRTVFWVMDIKRNGNAFFLADSGTYHFHRNVNQYVNGDASANVRGGSWKCDGLVVKPQSDQTPTGHHIYSLVTTGNVTANSLSQDRQVQDQRSGGRAISELIVFNRALSAEEVKEVEDYLAAKWTVSYAGTKEYTSTGNGTVWWSSWGYDNDSGKSVFNAEHDILLEANANKTTGLIVLNVAPGKTVTFNEARTFNAKIGVIIKGGGTVSTSSKSRFGATSIWVEYPSVLEFTGTADNNDSSTDCSRIQGTGTIRFKHTAGYRTFANSMWSNTLCFEAEAPNSTILVNNSTTTPTEIGTLSGTCGFRSDWSSGNRILRVTQAHNSTWSGKFNNDDRVAKMVVAGAAGAAEKILTIAGTHDHDNNLEVEPTGSVKLIGTWKGTTETIAGEFGGSGSIINASTISVKNGASIRADWGAVAANVAPTFEGMVKVVATTIPDGGVKLFSGTFTASDTAVAAATIDVAGVKSAADVKVKADGVYAVPNSEVDVYTKGLKYGYDFNGATLQKMPTAESTLADDGSWSGKLENGKLKLNAGGMYGDSQFSYGTGDWTLVTVAQAPGSGRVFFGLGGQKTTTGMIGIRHVANDVIAAYSGSTDLIHMYVPGSTSTYHAYTLAYNKASGTLKMKVDNGPFSEEVPFTTGTDTKWQLGAIHANGNTGYAASDATGLMDEFRLYTYGLSEEAIDGLVKKILPPVADIDGTEYATLQEACAVAAEAAEDVTIKLLADSAESVNLPANVTLNINGKNYFGAVAGSGTLIINKNISANADNTVNLPTTLTNSLKDDNTWKGEVVLIGGYNNVQMNSIFNLRNANSKITSKGNKGWLLQESLQNITLNLEDNDTTPALYISNSSGGWQYKMKLSGEGTLKFETVASTATSILVTDAADFSGSVQANNRPIYFGSTGDNGTRGLIKVNSNSTATIGATKTWTAQDGITIAGTIKGSGTLGSATTFENGATIDVSAGVLTAEAPVTFGATLKVAGGAVNQLVLKCAQFVGNPTVQDGEGANLGYLMATDQGLVITESAPVSEYTLTDDDKAEIAEGLAEAGTVLVYTIKGVVLTDDATVEGLPSDYYLIRKTGSSLCVAKKTKSVSIKFNPASANEGTIAATDDKVGGFPVAGAFWNHSKIYTGTRAATTELMTSIKDGQGNTLENTKVYYYMPNMYDVNSRSIGGRNKQATGNGKLTYSYFDDSVRNTPSSWPYTVLTDNGTSYTIPRTPAATESATANLGWCVAIQGMPYQVFDLYIYQASDQTAESITLLPIAVKANSGEWQYFAGDNKGSTIKTTINATWDGAAYCDTKEMTEGKNYIRYRISRATLGLADDEEIDTIYLSHPSRSSYSGRLGLAGIQIVEVENDGFYNRKADADNQDGEGHVKTNWTEAQTWLNSSGSPINWPTTKETAYVNINADTVAEITVNDKITADMVTVKNAADAQEASFKFLTLEDLGEVATEKPDAPYILNAPVDATGFHGDLYLQSRISGLVSVNSGVTVNFVANVAGEETTAYPYNFTGSINPIKKHGPGSFLVPSTMTGLSFNVLEGTLHYATDGTVPSVTGTGNVLITDSTIKIGNFNTFADTSVAVGANGVLDISGKSGNSSGFWSVTLDGGSLVSNADGGLVDSGDYPLCNRAMPVTGIALDADSYVGGAYRFGMIGNQWGATTLALGAYTLHKVDANDFTLCTATINGTGTIQVEAGSVTIRKDDKKSSATEATIQVDSNATFDLANNQEFVVKNMIGNGGQFTTTGEGNYKITGTLSGTATFGRVTFADGATIDATSGARTFTATPTFGTTLTIKVPASGEPTIMTFAQDVEAPTLPETITLVDAQGETVTTHGAAIVGSTLKIVRKTAANVYVLLNSTGYVLADGTSTTVVDGDTIIYDNDHFTAGIWGSGPDISAYTGTHKFIFNVIEMDIGHGNGIPANAQVEVNGQCYLYGNIGANATITGTGTLTVGFGSSHETTINDGVTISCSFGPGETGEVDPKTPNKAKIAGAVTVTGDNAIQGSYELLSNGQLTLKAKLDDGKVTSGDAMKIVDYNEATKTYSLVDFGFQAKNTGDEGSWTIPATVNDDIKTSTSTKTRTISDTPVKYAINATTSDRAKKLVVTTLVDLKSLPANTLNGAVISANYNSENHAANVFYTSDKKLSVTYNDNRGAVVTTETYEGLHLLTFECTPTKAILYVDGEQVAQNTDMNCRQFNQDGQIWFGIYCKDARYFKYVGAVYHSCDVKVLDADADVDTTEGLPENYTTDKEAYLGLTAVEKAKLAAAFIDEAGNVSIPGAYSVDGGAVITNPTEIREMAAMLGTNDGTEKVDLSLPIVAPAQTTDANTFEIKVDLSTDIPYGKLVLCTSTSANGELSEVEDTAIETPTAGAHTFSLDSLTDAMGEGNVLFIKVKALPLQ